jgi:Secretion system C-terminal sorting domain
MKNLIRITLLFISINAYTQQTCDILTGGVASVPSNIQVGQTSDLTYTIYNDAGGSNTCFYQVNSVEVTLSLPANGVVFTSFLTPIHGAYFDWTYDASENVVVGFNHTPIYDSQGETVKVRVTAVSPPAVPFSKTIGLSIFQNPLGPGFSSNDPSNDNGFTTINATAAPFPVELIDFRGIKVKDKHQLLWSTSSELNSNYFEIERSKDGKNWNKIGDNIKAAGNSNVFRHYEFMDNNPLNGINYYRLVQVDLDGKLTYTKVVILINERSEISVFPSPASSQFTITIPSDVIFTMDGILTIRNIEGKTLYAESFDKDKRVISIDVSTFSNGNYIVNIENDQIDFNQKLIIQH